MTFKTTIIAAGALIAAGAMTVPAAQAGSTNFSLQFTTPNASVYFTPAHRGPRWQRQMLSPREVRRILRHRGYRNIRFIDRRAPVYVARAVAHNGRAYRVKVSARNGRIIGQRALGGQRHYRGHRHYRGGGRYWGYRSGWRY